MKRIVTIMLIAGAAVSLSHGDRFQQLENDHPVDEIRQQLGGEPSPHKPDYSLPGVSVENGSSLVLSGWSWDANGHKTSKQSNHFECTACHNIEKELADLSVDNPQERLEYASQRGMPFLQGSTLYGVVNRTSFYNGDYYKKYGSLVDKAQHDLREAIQVCATECSQGRALEDWEMESVLAYLWSIDLKVGDLTLTEDEWVQVEKALNGEGDTDAARAILDSSFMDHAPATFIDPPPNRSKGNGELAGDPENGKLIYELSCLHCHERKRYSLFNLDRSTETFRYLKRHMVKYTRYSAYQVIRYGTSPIPGKKAYMPQYTEEKLDRQQMRDLRAYIEMMAQ